MISANIFKLFFALAIAVTLSACSKKLNSEGCPTNQMCTMEFATLGLQFVDGAGNAVAVKNVTITNKRTNQPIVANNDAPASGNYVIVTDANKKRNYLQPAMMLKWLRRLPTVVQKRLFIKYQVVAIATLKLFRAIQKLCFNNGSFIQTLSYETTPHHYCCFIVNSICCLQAIWQINR
ncbi:hypothetical protein FPZ43_10060 [Mucilaginibacter pallidiroseus]|uniref:Uncharacterized protein n=2 Tax=Mucilaginibacter pallidiroseus TaxID=2599295 RepID=A0A563UDA4_9SPHI|nr:hypothetical protein FPZ43_10060 [Mucilaginibacter pallidiroseus]